MVCVMGRHGCVTAREMTDALVQINDRIALAAIDENRVVTFFCECGDCLAIDVHLTLNGHEEIRAREDLIFAPGHETAGHYRKPDLPKEGWWRDRLVRGLGGIADARLPLS
jgi:hypothetical protein